MNTLQASTKRSELSQSIKELDEAFQKLYPQSTLPLVNFSFVSESPELIERLRDYTNCLHQIFRTSISPTEAFVNLLNSKKIRLPEEMIIPLFQDTTFVALDLQGLWTFASPNRLLQTHYHPAELFSRPWTELFETCQQETKISARVTMKSILKENEIHNMTGHHFDFKEIKSLVSGRFHRGHTTALRCCRSGDVVGVVTTHDIALNYAKSA